MLFLRESKRSVEDHVPYSDEEDKEEEEQLPIERNTFDKKWLLLLVFPLMVFVGILAAVEYFMDDRGIPQYGDDVLEEHCETTTPVIPYFNYPLEGKLVLKRKLRKTDINYFAFAIKSCHSQNASLTVVTSKKMITQVLSKANEADLIQCNLVLLGMRIAFNDWVNRDGTMRFYNGLVNSLWDSKLYHHRKNAGSKCSVLTEEGRLSPYHCKYTSDCILCQKRGGQDGSCIGDTCYVAIIYPKRIRDAEAECQKINGTLSLPSSVPMIALAKEELRIRDVFKVCKTTAIGFIRKIFAEDYLGNPIETELVPFSEAGKSFRDNCVMIDYLKYVFTRTDCNNPICFMCTVPKH